MEPNALIYGGISVPAKLRTGAELTVKLRLIKISEIPKFLDVAADEWLAVLFCVESVTRAEIDTATQGKRDVAVEMPAGDDFTDESFEAIVERNTELNFTRALAMSDRRLKRAESCHLELTRVAEKLASLLSRYSPKSPSPAATLASSSST